jgi:CelD/BcsL family acetyltransferase involved in cellulose biosynthesis
LTQRFNVLRSLANVWSFRYEFPGSAEATTRLLSFLLKSSRWDAIYLEKVAEDSTTFSAANALSAEQGWQLEVEPQICSPYRLLPSQIDGWETGLKSKFKRNLRNRSRRLASEGSIDFKVVSSVDEKAETLDKFYALEASGWKGQQGTAICQVPEARILFDELVKSDQNCWLPLLSLNDRPIAAQIVQTTGSQLYLLKTAYDTEYSAFSPGQLITSMVMAYCVEQGIEVFDFLGDTMTWKMDWEPELRQHYRLSLYAPSLRGRMAQWRDYKLRREIKRLPGAAPAVRWLRRMKGRS